MATTIKVDDVLEAYLRKKQQELYQREGIKVTLSATLHHVFYKQIKSVSSSKTDSLKKNKKDKTNSLISNSEFKKEDENNIDATQKTAANTMQRQVYDLKKTGKTNKEIAEIMQVPYKGISSMISKEAKKEKERLL